jgi:PPOX class probable F420-dependent enzyme
VTELDGESPSRQRSERSGRRGIGGDDPHRGLEFGHGRPLPGPIPAATGEVWEAGRVNVEEARAFLAQHHRAVLVTTRGDGRPQASPVVTALDDAGWAVVSTRETARKVAHVRRHPFAALCVFTDAFFGPWVQVEGAVDLVRLPEAMDGLVALYRTVAGEHPDWDDFRRAMVRERRLLLRVAIERVGPTRQG